MSLQDVGDHGPLHIIKWMYRLNVDLNLHYLTFYSLHYFVSYSQSVSDMPATLSLGPTLGPYILSLG